jgi:hypothetical protein
MFIENRCRNPVLPILLAAEIYGADGQPLGNLGTVVAHAEQMLTLG